MGCRFPGSPNLPAFWRTVRDGRVWSAPIPRSRWNHDLFYSDKLGARDPNKTYVNRLCMVDDPGQFAPDAFGITPRRARIMDPQQRLFLDAVRAAIEDAGYARRPLPRDRVGTYVGATVSDFMDLVTVRMRATLMAGGEFGQGLTPTDAYKALTKDVVPLQAYTVVGSLLNMVAANVSQCFDFGGPAFTTDAACSSALVALHEAVLHLRHGLTDAALVGGVYMVLSPDNVLGFARIGAVSASNACRPFDLRADGFVVGEGVGAVMLKRLDDALASGDHVYAVIRGVGINNDGKGEGPMTPRKEGQLAVLDRAYADAGVDPRTVDLLEAHGTATPVGDATEVAALAAFRGATPDHLCALSSVKANVGHSMSAAGIVGLIRAALSVDRREITPHAAYGQSRPELALAERGFVVPDRTTAWAAPARHPRRAGVNSFGFGGTNVHVVLEEAPPPHTDRAVSVQVPGAAGAADRARTKDLPSHPHAEPASTLFLVSAPTGALLAQHAADLRQSLLDAPGTEPARVAYTLSLRKPAAVRAAFVARTRDELLEALAQITTGAAAPDAPTNGRLHVGEAPAEAPQVAFLFPGQGAQAPDLARDLYDRFPAFREALEALAGGTQVDGRSLLSYLYPRNGARERAMTELTRTEVCQPIMAALGLATAAFLRELGVVPMAVAGHSLGEFAAAADAGLLPPGAAVALVAARGQHIAGLSLEDRGAMAAIAADVNTVTAGLEGLAGVGVANVNHPRQTVIAGTTAAVRAAQLRFDVQGTKSRTLSVSHAFHSPLMEGLRPRFTKDLAALTFSAPHTTLVSAVSEQPYPTEPEALRQLWADHGTRSVDFVTAVHRLAAQGATVFVQVGAGSALASMARATLASAERPHLCLPATGGATDETEILLDTLARLFVAGIDLRAEALFAAHGFSPATLPASVLETRHLWPVKKEEGQPVLRVDQTEPREPAPMSNSQARQGASSPEETSSPQRLEQPASEGLSALFRDQMAVLESHVAIIRQQNELLLRRGLSESALPHLQVTSAPRAEAVPVSLQAAPTAAGQTGPSVSAPAPVAEMSPAASAGTETLSLAEAEAACVAAAARITASPLGSLSGQTRLGADLGFDSLMVVELISALTEAFPGLELPRSAFAGDVTLTQLARQVVQILTDKARAATRPARQTALRHVPSWQPAELPPATSGPLDDAPVVVLVGEDASALPLAEALARAAEASGRIVRTLHTPQLEAAEASVARGAHLFDLRFLSVSGTASARSAVSDAEDLVGPALAALVTARSLEAGKPASWRLVRSGLGAGTLDGFAKALAAEWEHTPVCTLEIEKALLNAPGTVAALLLAELQAGALDPDVRLTADAQGLPARFAAALVPSPEPLSPQGPALGQVTLVSGGAHGLGAKIARALVSQAGARVALLGRRPASDPKVTAFVAELEALGGQALYLACDVRDPSAVAAAVQQVASHLGPVELVVHAAGVAHDAPVAAKSATEAAEVLRTKLVGAQNLWLACQHQPLTSFVALGSWAGRFGNTHQTDYAAANAGLAPLLAGFHVARPSVRTTVLELPPWEGGGLVEALSEPARKALAARVRFLSDAEGLPAVLEALAARGDSGALVLGAAPTGARQRRSFVRTVSVDSPGYLAHHVIAARPVLPLAGAVDWMVEAARAHGHGAPLDLSHITVVEGVVLEGPTATLQVSLDARPGDDGASLSVVRLDHRPRVGFRARLATPTPALAPVVVDRGLAAPELSIVQFYAEGTFHGPALQAITQVQGLGATSIVGQVKALPVEGGSPLVAALDGVLQLFGFWSAARLRRGGLPLSLAQLVLHRMPEGHEALTVYAVAKSGDGGRLHGDADVRDAAGALVMQLRGFEAEPREIALGTSAAGNGHTNGHGKATNGHGHAVQAPAALVVPSAHHRIEEFPEVKDLEQRMAMAKAMGIAIPYFRSHEGVNAATATIDGQALINYSSYNYLGFSGHPEVTRAAKEALDRYGSSVSASRIASGQRPLHSDLEAELARLLGCEDAIVMVGGHATNVSVLGHLLGPEDFVVHDSLAHDSILGGVKLSGARRRPFPHNDVAALERILRDTRAGVRRALIAVEGVYSMDGDIAPLAEIIELKKRYGALLLVDEAHSVGVLGATGRGVGEHFDVDRSQVDLWMGTLSKSFASCGGYIAGSHRLVQYLRYTVPGFVYSVGISPPNAAAALAAIRLMEQHPELVTGLREKSRTFLELLRARGLDTGPSEGSAVIPCVVGNSYICLQLSQALLARGINVQPILYPAVEENQARLRFFISVTHTDEQLRTTADILAEELHRLMPPTPARPAAGVPSALPSGSQP